MDAWSDKFVLLSLGCITPSMKTFLSVLFAILVFTQLKAQDQFIQPGAEWHYELMPNSSFRQYVHSDTVINGMSCVRIRTVSYIDTLRARNGFDVYPLNDKFIFSSGDTVYAYNRLFGKFTPTYIFNVEAGDTITLPMHLAEGAVAMYPKGDSTFSLIIDSVKMELYDTVYLKTVYTRPDSRSSGNLMDYGKYVWRMGGASGLLPKCVGYCPAIMDDRAADTGPIRCYSDESISVKYTAGSCRVGVPVSVAMGHNSGKELSVYPNPATATVHIYNPGGIDISAVTLLSVDGRVHQRYGKEALNGIAVDTMQEGIYLLQLHTAEGSLLTRKLIIYR